MNKECDGNCEPCSNTGTCEDPRKGQYLELKILQAKMEKIKHKIAVISGKGGVGKSTVTANLAMAFAIHGHANSVGILDADIHGPCIPKMLGLQGQKLKANPTVLPVTGPQGIKIVSMAFLLSSDEVPVIWRSPLKVNAIRQFLFEIEWGTLKFLFIDLPPGTGDEQLSVMQLIPEMDGVVIVTIPSEVSQAVVKKAVTFTRHLGVPIIGIIENMSGFVCPKCGEEIDIFKSGGGKKIAEDLSVPFLGSIPIDPEICRDADNGMPFITELVDSPATKAFSEIVKKIELFLEHRKQLESSVKLSLREELKNEHKPK